MLFAWDEWNVDHISRHGVTRAEAEVVVRGAESPWPEQKGEDKLLVWGPTAAGRLLQVIFVLKDPDEIEFESLTIDQWADLGDDDLLTYVIHAMDLTVAMKRLYRRARTMKKKSNGRESFDELEKLAHDTSDIRPMSTPLRRQWEAARRTGARPGRPRKDPATKSRIVPISIEPALLEEVDRYADSAGVSRSRLVAEALRLRMST